MTYRVGDLELLALADVGRLGDGRLQSVEGSLVERLELMSAQCSINPFMSPSIGVVFLIYCCSLGAPLPLIQYLNVPGRW